MYCTIIIEYDNENELFMLMLLMLLVFQLSAFVLLVSLIKLGLMVSLKGICQWWKWWYIKYTDTTFVKFYIIPNLGTY